MTLGSGPLCSGEKYRGHTLHLVLTNKTPGTVQEESLPKVTIISNSTYHSGAKVMLIYTTNIY